MMSQNFLGKLGHAFGEILFLRFYPPQIKEWHLLPRILLYLFSVALFYVPVIYHAITLSVHVFHNVYYVLFLAAIHILSKFIRANSQKVQQRFSEIRLKKAFFLRVYLVAEYVFLMWMVYLLYPISCLLFPFCMLLTFYENLLGFHFFYDLLTLHTDQVIFYGSLISYALFIFMGSYKRVIKGSLPSYLSLYAVLTVISGFFDGVMNLRVPDGIQQHIHTFSSMLSKIFSLSNHALSIVSSGIVFISAICSLYITCGLDKSKLEQPTGDSELSE